MKIQVVRTSKLVRTDFQRIVDDYKKRLSPICRIEDTEIIVPPTGRDKRSTKMAIEPIYSSIQASHVVILDERGHCWDSAGFAKKLREWNDNPAVKNMAFIVGPPFGFDTVSRQLAFDQWSLSPLTIPSDFAWLLAWEQIYRGFTILKGMPYHHD